MALGYHSVMFVCSKTQVNSEREDILPTLFGDFAVPPMVRHLCASDYATPVVSLAIVWFITFEVSYRKSKRERERDGWFVGWKLFLVTTTYGYYSYTFY